MISLERSKSMEFFELQIEVSKRKVQMVIVVKRDFQRREKTRQYAPFGTSSLLGLKNNQLKL